MTEDTVMFAYRVLFNLGIFVMFLEPHFPTTEDILEIPPEYAYYEIIVPRKLARIPGKYRDQLSYIIKVEGKNYIVHLKQKDPLVKKFPVFTYVHGKPERTSHKIPGHCFFRGYIEGAVVSFVTLNACAGLRGLLQLENLTYNISPLEGSSAFQHLIYRTEEKEPRSQACWLSDRERPPSEVGLAEGNTTEEPETPLKTSTFLELFVQVDVHLFREHSENVSLTVHHVVSLIQMVDDMCFPLNLRVLLVGLGIWTERNLILVSDFAEETMTYFNEWRIKNILRLLKHRAGVLLARHSRGRAMIQYSSFGTVCNRKMAVAFASVRSSPAQLLAIGLAHDLGHVIGIPDDAPEGCSCAPNLKCIMHADGPVHGKPLFSNCSINSYFEAIDSKRGHCLRASPENVKLLRVSTCGNGVVEGDEECDCGSAPLCKANKCCLSNCTMAPKAVCTKEPCCKNCRFAPRGTLCRKATSECDLPEYCSGKAAKCAPDVFVQDGTPCGGNGYCFLGACATRALQCKKIFGPHAEEAPYPCFKRVNSRGDRFGNCGGGKLRDGVSDFGRCKNDDVLCGRVQCINVSKLPDLDSHMTLIQTSIGETVCWGLGSPSGLPVADAGAVGDGTKCGLGKVCLNHTCLRVADVVAANRTCDPLRSCGGNGVCNSKEHCHCHQGWDPPNCLFSGHGGSIDSGPVWRSKPYNPPTLIVAIIASFTLIIVVVSFPILMIKRTVVPSPTPSPQTMLEDAHLA